MASIEIARQAGACYGVERALKMALEAAAAPKQPVHTLGPLIHNPSVVSDLAARGVASAETPAEAERGTLVIRAHGVTPAVVADAEERGLTVIDATCPLCQARPPRRRAPQRRRLPGGGRRGVRTSGGRRDPRTRRGERCRRKRCGRCRAQRLRRARRRRRPDHADGGDAFGRGGRPRRARAGAQGREHHLRGDRRASGCRGGARRARRRHDRHRRALLGQHAPSCRDLPEPLPPHPSYRGCRRNRVVLAVRRLPHRHYGGRLDPPPSKSSARASASRR